MRPGGVANKTETMLQDPMSIVIDDSIEEPGYLSKLNEGQRAAACMETVRFPALSSSSPEPGQASTAHCVAHLIVRGADPRRILLMTFSRRQRPR